MVHAMIEFLHDPVDICMEIKYLTSPTLHLRTLQVFIICKLFSMMLVSCVIDYSHLLQVPQQQQAGWTNSYKS